MLTLFVLLAPCQARAAPERPTHDLFGVSVDAAGDVDRDGVPDLWVGDPSLSGPEGQRLGSAWCISGKDGSTLSRIRSSVDALEFGWTIVGLGDVDADGMRDVAVGSRHVEPTKTRTSASSHGNSWSVQSGVYVHSGRDGSILYSLRDPAEHVGDASHRFADAPELAFVGDWNDDEVDDFAIGWSYASDQLEKRGRVDVVSGRDGSTLRSWPGLAAGDRFGRALVRITDVDGDGNSDLAASAVPDADRRATTLEAKRLTRSGYVQILSSNGTILRTFRPEDGSRFFGSSLAFARRTKADGVDELFIGQPSERDSRVAITRWNLINGELVDSLMRPALDAWDGGWHNRNVTPKSTEVESSFANRLLAVPDRDGDGCTDVLATVPQFFCHVPAGVLSSKPSKDGRATPIGRVELGDLGFQYAEVGIGLCATGDVDADGVDDFALSGADVTCLDACTGCVVLVSGRTLRVLRTFTRAGRE